MVTVVVGNSVCKLIGLSEKQFKDLRKLLSYSLPAAQARYAGGHFAKAIPLLDKAGSFPTGLLYLVTQYFGSALTVIEGRVQPSADPDFPRMWAPHAAYPEQVEAAKACLQHHRGIVVAPTGCGKSLIAALIINELKVRTLVVVPSLELKRQLSETLGQAFGASNVGKGRTIWVENVDALSSKVLLKDYDAVIIDEFHHSGAKTYRKLNKTAWSGVYYKIGMTATPFRSQDHERLLLESVLSQVIYRIEYQTAVNKGYIVPLEAYFYEIPAQAVPQDANWPQVYKQLVTNNEVRNTLITEVMVGLERAGLSTLCLVKEINHGERLSNGGAFMFSNGEDEESKLHIQQFNQGEILTLVGTTGVLGEGIDTKPAEWVIIAGLGKSKNSIMQQVGRAFRRFDGKVSAKIILFKDPSHRWTKAHFKEQVKILEQEYGVSPVKIELT